MTKIKCKSHVERMAEPSNPCDLHLMDSYVERGTEQEVKEGIVLKKAVYKTVSPKGKFDGMKASDFALENIIAVGALDSLHDMKLNDTTLGVADGVEGSMENMVEAFDAAELNVEPQNNE